MRLLYNVIKGRRMERGQEMGAAGWGEQLGILTLHELLLPALGLLLAFILQQTERFLPTSQSSSWKLNF